MNLLVRIACLSLSIALLLSPLVAFGREHCRPLIHFDFNRLTVSDAQQQQLTDSLYQALLSAAEQSTNGAPLLSACKPYSQITLSDDNATLKGRYVSSHQLGTIPGFARLSVPGHSFDKKTVGQQRRPYTLQFDYPTYPIESDDTAMTLLRNGRVSHVVDYASNIPIYQERLHQVTVERLRSTTPIYLLFDQASFRDQFDRVVAPILTAALGNERLPASEPMATDIQWLVLNKIFSRNQDLLVAMDSEIAALEWLDAQLETYTFSIGKTNSTRAMERLQTETNVCVFGIYKTPEREALAWFSQPTSWFLSPRLYINKKKLADMDLAGSLDQVESPDVIAALKMHSWMAIGYVPELLQTLPRLKSYMESEPNRFLNIGALERERMLALYNRQRLDGFIDYPSHLAQIIDEEKTFPEAESVALMQQKIVGQAYAACSKTGQGHAMIDALNQTLSDPAARFDYISTIAKGMMPQEQRILHEAAGTLQQLNQGNTH